MVKVNQAVGEKKKTFFKFQVTALTATAIDFLVTVILREMFNVYYTWAVAAGATSGAITAFTINRYWVFKSLEQHALRQGLRYLLVAGGSILLNTAGTFIITEMIQIPYLISKTLVALVIGFTYSYYFSKRFVFYA